MLKRHMAALAALFLLALPMTAIAQTPPKVEGETTKMQEDILDYFGVGLSFSIDSGKRDHVKSASLDPNGIVRIDDRENAKIRLLGEAHYFFEPTESGKFGIGPFVAIEFGDEVFSGLGGGLMVGMKRPQGEKSFNIGVGYMVDLNVQVLGDGIVKNQPLPPGETQIRYQEREQGSWVIITSFGF